MTDHDDIPRRLREAVELTPPRDEDIRAVGSKARRRRAVRWTAWLGITAAVLVVAGSLVQRLDGSNRVELVDRSAITTDTTTAGDATDTEPGWVQLPPSPLDPRWGAFSAWTGDELLIWGGYAWPTEDSSEGPRSDGAAYDGESWSELPPGPLPELMRHHGVAAWTGDELWIVGGTGGDDGTTPSRAAAAYQPASGTWRDLPPVPAPISDGVWVGDQLVVVAQARGASRAVYALGAGSQEWRQLAALPPPDTSAEANSDLHLLAAAGQVAVVGLGEVFALDTGATDAVWQRLPTPDDEAALDNVRGAAAETGAIIVILSDGTYRYDLHDGAWSRIADGLQPEPPQPIPVVSTDQGVLVAVDVVSGIVHALAEDDHAWIELADLDSSRVDASVEVAGDQVMVWGGMGSEQPDAAQGLTLRAAPSR